MKRNLIIGLGAGALLLAWLAFDGASDQDELSYALQPVTRGDVESVVITTGTLEALNTIIVGSQLSGQIAELHADFNDQVSAGELIARIDPRTFEARVRQAEADVRVAEASIAQREAEVLRATATLAQAERELARRESLKADGHVSASELDADLTAVETAAAQLKMAEAAVVNAEAVLEQRRATLNQAEVDLERTYIRSPVAGTVINRTVEIGQTVAASLQAPELFQIAQDLHQMKVEASVDEADIGRLAEGMSVRFTVDAYPERRFQGRVEQIRKAPDRVQNVVTYRVIIAAANDDLALLPGMTASVEVVLGQREDVLRLPNAALRYAPKGRSLEDARGRPGPTAMVERLTETLDLTPTQIEQLEALVAAQQQRVRARLSGQRGEGAVPEAGGREAFQQMRQALQAEVRALLTDDQRRQFDAMRSDRPAGDARRARVWILENEEPVPRDVLVGLGDDESTELIRGLSEGEQVIVRATRTRG